MYSRKTFVFFREMFCIFLTISRCYAKIMAKEDDSMDFLTMTIRKQKNIALIAHDNKKRELIDWCEANKEILKKHFLCGTGTTARMITEYSDFVLTLRGDFSEEEVVLARHHGFVPVTLGTSRLRTETAGIVACHSIDFMNRV